tara:strand:+ start:486 stop:1031 length:546 start_codon:yes stop_codon:yes gene_type:complete
MIDLDLQWVSALLESKTVIAICSSLFTLLTIFVVNYFFPRLLQRQKQKHEEDLVRLQYEISQRERLFERRVAAVDAFLKLENKLRPTYRPGIVWSEACEDFAIDLGRVALELERFLEEHTVGLKPAALEKLQGLPGKAEQNSFFTLDDPEDVPPKESIEAASEILTALTEARSLVLENVRA